MNNLELNLLKSCNLNHLTPMALLSTRAAVVPLNPSPACTPAKSSSLVAYTPSNGLASHRLAWLGLVMLMLEKRVA